MKRRIFLTESELVKLALIIAEQINFDAYDDEDFLDAFFQIFRNYLKKDHGEKTLDYPMSYLLKKYSISFVKDTFGDKFLLELAGWNEEDDEEDLDEFLQDWVITRYDAKKIVIKAIENQRYSLPTLLHQEKFTEKYKSIIDDFLKNDFDLPDYVTAILEEPNPHTFNVKMMVDFKKWVEDPNQFKIDRHEIEQKTKRFLEGYLGVEFGLIKYGKSEMGRTKVEYVGVDAWVKNELNKKIKKEFKTLPDSRYVKSIKFKEPSFFATLDLVFHGDTKFINIRSGIITQYRNKLKELGYGPNLQLT